MHTPVLPTDHVGDVLSRDLALIDVFVRHSSHFAKLRNPVMRRTMARLVTVEHAARIAGVSADTLVHALNEALGIDDSASPAAPAAHAAAADHEAAATPLSRRPADAREVELDVRDDLRSGREPFSRIMAAVATLADGEVLHLRTIFEPVPLYAVLRKRGFAHEAHAHALDDWSVWFWRANDRDAAHSDDASRSSRSARTPAGADAGETTAGATPRERDAGESDETWLDVRGLEPPEPMVRTLAALETLPAGHTLVQVNVRVPQFLLPILAERGFAYQVDETRPEHVLVRIRRGA